MLTSRCRVFLVRTGSVNPGVIMAGRIRSDSIDFEPDGNYVKVTWDSGIRWNEAPALRLADVFGPRRGAQLHKLLQQSGVPLMSEETSRIQARWRSHARRSAPLKKIGVRPRPTASRFIFLEGGSSVREVFEHRRDPMLRRLLHARAHPPACQCCGLVPSEKFGPIVGDILEVHHLVPIRAGERETGIRDVRLVCPNCHRALHAKDPPLTIAQLRAIRKNRPR